MPMHESSCIEDPSFLQSLSFCCQLVSLPFDCLPCLDARTLWLNFESPFIPLSSMHVVSVASDLLDFSGTLAENVPPTGYEPNDHFTTEAYVEYTQESSGEQRYPHDFDCDDVTIGKTLLDACRKRADHSEEEGLSSCLSSSVSHDRKVRHVVCSLGPQFSSSQEIQRQNKETNDVDKINNYFMNSYCSKIGIFVKLMRKASVKWKN